MTEQVGWFACRIAGISFEKLELELMVELDKTVESMNSSDTLQEYEEITQVPRFEISRTTVYELNDSQSRSTQAVDIRCESMNSELLKNILVTADLDTRKFGCFMMFSNRMANQWLHYDMFQKHAAFTNDTMVIAVEGLHEEVLDEMVEIPANSGQWEKVIDKLLKTNNSPIWAIEHTRLSQSEGRFLFVTDRTHADETIGVIQNELVSLAHQTVAFHKHVNDGEKFFRGIQRVEPRMTRRVRHEQSVRSRYSAVTAQESASARQGSRFRQVTVSNAPWSLEDFPLMVPATSPPAYEAPVSYACALTGIPAPNAEQETVPMRISGPKGSINLKTSITSELGDDTSTLLSLASTVAEQSQLIKNLMKKAEDQEAVEARINLAMSAKLAEQEANRVLEAHLVKLKQDEKDEAHRTAQARSVQELQDSETRHRESTTALLLAHQAEMKNALEQMALRDELHQQELETARSQHTQDLNKMMQQVEENNTNNKTEVSGNLKDMTTSLMLHMSAMMEHHAFALPIQPHSQQHPGDIEVDAACTEASPITMTTRTDPNTQVEPVTKEAAYSLQGTLETQATSIPQGEVDEEAMETEGLELLTQEEPRTTPLPIEVLASNQSESTLQTSDQMETITRSQGGQDLSDDQATMHQDDFTAHQRRISCDMPINHGAHRTYSLESPRGENGKAPIVATLLYTSSKDPQSLAG
jgi:hypothetical protein